MSYSLSFLKASYIGGLYKGSIIRAFKGDTRSLDYISYRVKLSRSHTVAAASLLSATPCQARNGTASL